MTKTETTDSIVCFRPMSIKPIRLHRKIKHRHLNSRCTVTLIPMAKAWQTSPTPSNRRAAWICMSTASCRLRTTRRPSSLRGHGPRLRVSRQNCSLSSIRRQAPAASAACSSTWNRSARSQTTAPWVAASPRLRASRARLTSRHSSSSYSSASSSRANNGVTRWEDWPIRKVHNSRKI